MTQPLSTPRLSLRAWQLEDAAAALTIYGHPDVTRWLSPTMDRVGDLPAMRLLLQQWIVEDARASSPAGHWAIVRGDDGMVIGGARLLPLPPGHEDLEIGWQLHPDVWGRGYASETTYALASWAFSQDIDEIFAIVRPDNVRGAATVRRNGMHWVGETDKYFDLTLYVYRLRPADLDAAAPHALRPPPNHSQTSHDRRPNTPKDSQPHTGSRKYSSQPPGFVRHATGGQPDHSTATWASR